MIKSLKIQNFKTIGNEEFLLSNLNLFTGLNGMGKSTLLQSLLLVRQSFLSNSINYNGKILLNGELIRLGYGVDIYSQYALGEKKIRFEFVTVKSKGKWLLKWDSKNENDKLDNIQGALKATKDFFETSLFNDNFIYLCADRIGPQLSYPIESIDKIRKKRLGNKGEFALQYLNLLADEDLFISKLKHEDSKTNNILDNLNLWLGEISPGVRIVTTPNTDFEAMRLVFQFDSGPDNVFTNEFRPVNVGFGLTYILSILISLLTAKKEDILILENPEAHLHPRGQSKIGTLISLAAQNGVQCFVETHSDHIINGIRLSVYDKLIKNNKVKIFFFDRKKGSPSHISKIHRINIDQNAKLSDFPDGFFDEWNKALFKLVKFKQ